MSMRLKREPWTPDVGEKLTENETDKAMTELYTTFPRLERGYRDPKIERQNIALFSFVPAEKNDLGLYGFAKIRGVFEDEDLAKRHARKLVKKFDSVNAIHHVEVGKAFPIGDVKIFKGKEDKVVMDDMLEEAERKLKIEDDERERANEKFFEERRQELFADVDPNKSPDPVEEYITKREKIANVSMIYEDYLSHLEKMKTIIKKTYVEMRELESKEGVLETYRERYYARLAQCGLDRDISEQGQKLRKYFDTLPKFDFLDN